MKIHRNVLFVFWSFAFFAHCYAAMEHITTKEKLWRITNHSQNNPLYVVAESNNVISDYKIMPFTAQSGQFTHQLHLFISGKPFSTKAKNIFKKNDRDGLLRWIRTRKKRDSDSAFFTFDSKMLQGRFISLLVDAQEGNITYQPKTIAGQPLYGNINQAMLSLAKKRGDVQLKNVPRKVAREKAEIAQLEEIPHRVEVTHKIPEQYVSQYGKESFDHLRDKISSIEKNINDANEQGVITELSMHALTDKLTNLKNNVKELNPEDFFSTIEALFQQAHELAKGIETAKALNEYYKSWSFYDRKYQETIAFIKDEYLKNPYWSNLLKSLQTNYSINEDTVQSKEHAEATGDFQGMITYHPFYRDNLAKLSESIILAEVMNLVGPDFEPLPLQFLGNFPILSLPLPSPFKDLTENYSKEIEELAKNKRNLSFEDQWVLRLRAFGKLFGFSYDKEFGKQLYFALSNTYPDEGQVRNALQKKDFQLLTRCYKIHLMPAMKYMDLTMLTLFKCMQTHRMLFAENISKIKIILSSLESEMIEEGAPRIVIYIDKGKKAGSIILNLLNQYFKDFSAMGCGWKPMYNKEVIKNFLYYAQGDRNAKQDNDYRSYFEQPEMVHYRADVTGIPTDYSLTTPSAR